ncbi:MAG: hypothetical protein IAF58_03445 [Leptolyngbya sp.]|nr:hypothetical protein [Candidatus Melainabacteria bacterium]
MKHFKLRKLKPSLIKEANLLLQWGLCLLPFILMLGIRFITHWLELNHGDVDAAIATAINCPTRGSLAFDRALEDSFGVGAVSISVCILMTLFRPKKTDRMLVD